MPLLDTLEVWFTRKPQQRPLSPSAAKFVSSSKWLTNWLGPPLPDRDMKATDFYSLSLYLRCAWGMVARLPVLFHIGRMQARIWHGLWKAAGPMLVAKGFILLPFVPLAWVLFALILYLPRTLFWNRRARRLVAVGETLHAEEIIAVAAPDASAWPPPPH